MMPIIKNLLFVVKWKHPLVKRQQADRFPGKWPLHQTHWTSAEFPPETNQRGSIQTGRCSRLCTKDFTHRASLTQLKVGMFKPDFLENRFLVVENRF